MVSEISTAPSNLREPFEVPPFFSQIYSIVDKLGSEGRLFLGHTNEECLQKLSSRGFATLGIERQPDYSTCDSTSEQTYLTDNRIIDAPKLIRKIIRLNPHMSNILRLLCKFYRIDEVNVLTSTSGINNGSDFWHRDGVGHRIKVFIPLYLQGNPPATHIFSSSHLDSCHPMRWEMYRVNQEDPHRQPHQEFIQKHHTPLFGIHETLQWSYDRVILIDTNTIHRAGNFVGIAKESWRCFASLELMEPLQSYAANKYRLGECNTRRNERLISLVHEEIDL